MKAKMLVLGLGLGICLGLLEATAGPSLQITKPPVVPSTQLTGPPVDPPARYGQWFVDSHGMETVRTNELYDDMMGGQAGTHAISGHVSSVQFAIGLPPQPITAFDIEATIINDAGQAVQWYAGSNSHGESLVTSEQYAGPLVDTKLAAEFAIVDLAKLPQPFTSPYRDRQPYIVAENEDQAAWYCWNPEDQNQEHQPKGDYFVPTWDFGTIPPGQSATRSLHFSVPAGLPSSDSRYAVIMQSYMTSNDVLQNRTTSLKISTWIDEIAADPGNDEEQLPYRHSDVSVFHNPGVEEPELLDFGDAPDPPYPTLRANDGARHVVAPGVFMGLLIDVEADGQPDANATGDDKALLDDEDGVVFLGQLLAGQTATVQVTVSTSGYVYAWLDFGADGSWAQPSDYIVNGMYFSPAGTYNIAFSVPASAVVTNTFSRFRFTTLQTPLSYTGLALDGEVEDHGVDIRQEEPELLDFGDAMDSPVIAGYPTLLINNGARHMVVPGVWLGATVDIEPDGQPTPNADGDDNNPLPDDEDGVSIPSPLVAGAAVQVVVSANVPGYLNAWIDWNSDGDWADPGEQVFVNTLLNPGANFLPLNVPVPPALVAGGPHSRWRFTTYAPMMPMYTGLETNGEVEDYEVRLEVLDFGDAPDSYQTLLASDGARHRIPSAYYIGIVAPDLDPDGQPTAAADGDDTNGAADEDCWFLPAPLVQGDPAAVIGIQASTNGYLNAWLDFNQDGVWAGLAEQIATDLALVSGGNPVTFAVPATARLGRTYSRFRFASTPGLGSTSLALDGEVEDHVFTIYQNGPTNPAGFEITNIVHTATNEMTIWWDWETNVTYQAQWATNLLSDSNVTWTGWGGYVFAPPYQQVDSNAVPSNRFYRVVVPFAPPPP